MPSLVQPESWLGFTLALIANQWLATLWHSRWFFGSAWRAALGGQAQAQLAEQRSAAGQARWLAGLALALLALANGLDLRGASSPAEALLTGGLFWLLVLLPVSLLRPSSRRAPGLGLIRAGFWLASALLSSQLLILG